MVSRKNFQVLSKEALHVGGPILHPSMLRTSESCSIPVEDNQTNWKLLEREDEQRLLIVYTQGSNQYLPTVDKQTNRKTTTIRYIDTYTHTSTPARRTSGALPAGGTGASRAAGILSRGHTPRCDRCCCQRRDESRI